MPLILGTNSIKDTGYDVANSLMFSSDHYLTKSFSSAGNRQSWTWSAWIKRSKQYNGTNTNANRQVWFGGYTASNDTQWLEFGTQGDIFYYTTPATSASGTRNMRDLSGWFHAVVIYNGSNIKFYFNNVLDCTLSLSGDRGINVGGTHTIGALASNQSSRRFEGYMTEVCFIDGSQLDPDQFGEFDEDSPTIWKPKDVSGLTFGTNGFYLDFEDSSALGNDVSGNNNDFTANNISATDQSTDTCTNNFCTMNPLDNYYASNTYSEGNIKFVTKASGGFAYGTSTIGLSSGKWYAEFDCIATTDSGAYHQVGIVEKPSASTTTSATANIGSTAYSWGYFALNGKYRNNNSYSTYGDSWTTGDIIGVYLNLDDNELRFSKNGVIQNSGTAISITAPSSNGTGHYFITAGGMSTNASVTFEANFGNPFQSQSSSVSDANGYGAFEYSPTLSGVNYYSINTKNLAEFG
jgi:hypothetical protein